MAGEGRAAAAGWEFPYAARGEGPPLLLLPGTAAFLPAAHRGLLPRGGLPGFRVLSPAWPPARRIGDLAAGAAAVLDAEGLERAPVAGASFGGYAAQALARAHPRRVSHLALVNASGAVPGMAGAMRLLVLALHLWPRRGLARQAAALFAPHIRGPPGLEAEVRAAAARAFEQGMDRERMLAVFRCTLDFLRQEARGPGPWAGPVLLVESDDDPAVKPAWRAALRARWPGARVAVLRGAGHTPDVSAPAALAGELRAFLDAPARAPA